MSRSKSSQLTFKVKTDPDWETLTELEKQKQYGWSGKKFKPELGRGTGITPLGKLVAKNANRSVIKAVRQEGKKEISKELE